MSVYVGQSFTFTVEGHEFRADIQEDSDRGAPWENCEGNIDVTRVSHGYAKRAGECFLYVGSRKEYSYIYDVRGAQGKARAESWECADKSRATFVAKHGREPGPREMAVLAVRDNAEYLREWCADDWQYVGVGVFMLDSEGETVPGREDAIWGVESRGDYAREELAPEMARGLLACLKREKAQEETEAQERVYWASRGVETVGA